MRVPSTQADRRADARARRLAFILFETLLFGLTLFKFVQAVRTGWGHTPVMALLARDGTWAFALIFGASRICHRTR